MNTPQSDFTKIMDLAIDPKKGVVSGPFGSNLKTSDYTPSGFPIIRLQNVKRMKLNSSNLVFTSQSKAEELSSHSFEPGDILVSKLGDDLGRACIAPKSLGPGIVSADVVRIRVDPAIADVEYVMLAINAPSSTLSLVGDIQGVTRPRVSLNDIRNLEIYLPSILEQKKLKERILNQLGIEKQLKLKLTNSQKIGDDLRSSIFISAFTGRLVPTEADLAQNEGREYERAELFLEQIIEERRSQFEANNPGKKYKQPVMPNIDDMPEIPEGWCYSTIDQLSHRVTKGTTPTSLGFPFTETGIRFVKAESLDGESIIHSMCANTSIEAHQALARSQLEEGDLLITIAGTLGRTAIVSSSDIPANTNQAVSITRLVDSSLVEYIHLYVNSPMMFGRYQAKGKGVGLKNLNLTQIRESVIPLPPRSEIDRIVFETKSRLKLLNQAKNKVRKSHDLLQYLSPSILNSAFSKGE